MHIAPMVFVAHDGGHDVWIRSLTDLVTALTHHPDLPLTLRLPGAAIAHLSRHDPEAWHELTTKRVMWLAGGWSDPVLTHLTPRAQQLQLDREQAAMEATGISPDGLWTADAWEPSLVELAHQSGLSLVLLDEAVLTGSIDRPGVVDRAGTSVFAMPVTGSFPPRTGDGDGLAVVRTSPRHLPSLADFRPGCLTTPDEYLQDHLPGERLRLGVSDPGRNQEVEPFYRQLLRVTADQPERGAGLDALLALQSRQFTSGDGGGWQAHRDLIDARVQIDRAAHRGDSWVTVGDVDWDGDGISEVQIETTDTTLVVDPVDGTLDVWDHKPGRWPILAGHPPLPGVLMRQMSDDGNETIVDRLTLDRRMEGRAEARLTLTGEAGVECQVAIVDGTLHLELTIGPTDRIRLGPELPLLLDPAHTVTRVDGGDWLETGAPLALTGHRFRFTDEERTMLVSASRPAELFVRPLDGRGLVVWPHWATTGDTTYLVSFAPSSPPP